MIGEVIPEEKSQYHSPISWWIREPLMFGRRLWRFRLNLGTAGLDDPYLKLSRFLAFALP